MQSFDLILVLIAAIIASQPAARVLKVVPLPIVQIAIGAALAWPVTRGVHVELNPDLFLLLFIPPLLFGDAWAAPKREFWEMRVPIASMAFGLVFFTILAFGYALNWLVPAVPLAVAFAAAAVLSPTDAVAVSSIVDRNAVPPRLMHLLEGESLLNDASGLVMFRFATAAALTGAFSIADASRAFIFAVLVGVAAGFASLWIARKALRILGKLETGAAEAQVLAMVLLPFMAYILAERWHGSGVLAAVISGMYLGRGGTLRHLGVSARLLATSTWRMVGFALNGAIFVFLGLQLPAIIRAMPKGLTTHHWLIQPILIVLALTLCLMALRYAFMWVGSLAARLGMGFGGSAQDDFGPRMKLAISVAGVRGAITLAGVLSLPASMGDGSPFPARDLVIFLATGVILCWLAIAAVVLPRLTRGLADDGHNAAAQEVKRARIAAAQAAIATLESLSATASNDSVTTTARQAAAEALIVSYRRRIAALEEGAAPRRETQAEHRAETELRQAAMDAETDILRTMLRRGEINDHTLHLLFDELTLGQAMISAKAGH